eukprot:CAMPEP_0173390954 /NCGR_PEP_ID=MMETSP1356-20130122/16696_1 /TAXON_ID=77927 ORGANISM="Hemiselmis virescens, Strain PCC157" /NCGR_SAMPLE_ID=MMETSP1356 /ASSEMBLY_ACC=CAM_ASM_000847 /LENGTH=75 /DNA_ID=CAMNT_0014348455 /DNA_START=224 /DNA_END=447 /DNA_ORIENTATION=+
MSIWKLRLGLNPFSLLLLVIVGLVCVCSYFYLLSFLLSDGSPYKESGQDNRRRLLSHAVPSAAMQLPVPDELFAA